MGDDSVIPSLIRRIAAEFSECPGLRLTAAQGARLWAVDARTIDLVLDTLVQRGTLMQTPDGAFMRIAGRCSSAAG